MNIPVDTVPERFSPQSGTSYTFSLNDLGRTVEGNNASAQTFTIPTAAVAGWPLGAFFSVYQAGAGQITIAGAGGVTLRGAGGAFKTSGQYAVIQAVMHANDEWIISGDSAA